MTSLNISEIFYSLQGEGARSGDPSIFIRLQGCSAKHACYASGIRCDTEFESGRELSIQELNERILPFVKQGCKWIVWTGGEPTDQLTDEHIAYFKELGFQQAIETSGLNPVPLGVDFISVSPKVAEHVLEKNFGTRLVDEVRYVRHAGQEVPQTKLKAIYHFISPHFDGYNYNPENIKHCISLCLNNPQWSLSIQQHKLINIL